jgi:hypothetical protein
MNSNREYTRGIPTETQRERVTFRMEGGSRGGRESVKENVLQIGGNVFFYC